MSALGSTSIVKFSDKIAAVRYLLCITLLVWAATTLAETLTGRVIGMSVTLTVLVSDQQVKVRFADIDAPERRS